METRANRGRGLPVGLEDLIKNALREAFFGHPNLNRAMAKLNIQHSNIADYQLNCRGVASCIDMKDEVIEVANRIKGKITESSPLIKKIEAENGFLNIYTNESLPQKCACKIKTNVGEQNILYSSGENTLHSNLIEDLSRRLSEERKY